MVAALLAGLVVGYATAAAASVAAPKPHIFMMVVDDFGWANFGPHRTAADDPSHEVQTPTMDALVKEGVLLDRNYLYWYCSPSRSALQTGRNPTHVNANNDDMALHNPNDPVGGYQGIPRNMTTFAWKLASAGYATHFYGKWHVGLATPDHTPAGRGWQFHEIYFDGANDYWTSISSSCKDGKGKEMPITDLWLDNAPAVGLNNSWACTQAHQPASCKYEDAMFSERTLAAIAAHNTSVPYLQVWTPHNIHAPLQVPAAYLTNFSFIGDSRRAAYAAKVKYIDDQLALVVAALKAKGMWESTFFVLTADNGGPIYDNGEAGANNWPLRGGKTSNHEGGVRGNGFVSGGIIPIARRGTIESGLVAIEDWYATFCALAGVDPTDERGAAAGLPPIDSLNMWPLLSGATTTSPRAEVVLGMPSISSGNSFGGPTGVQAVIDSEGFKGIIGVMHQNVWTSPAYPNRSTAWPNSPFDCSQTPAGICLFNVFSDPTEHVDIAASNPAKAAELLARIKVHNATLYAPDRGTADPRACEAALGKWGGFWGPWLA